MFISTLFASSMPAQYKVYTKNTQITISNIQEYTIKLKIKSGLSV